MGETWRLSGYRVDRLLGAGAFGEVWQARVRSTGASVALKRVRMTDRSRRNAAVAEAAVLGALDHPNLIRLHRLERNEDAIVLVLDLAAGGSLAALLGARGRLTPGETISALSPIAAALASAHAVDVVHGDVTPANILFSDFGMPLLADLGMARLVGDTKPVHTTLPYADPIVAQGYVPDPASDVYMLGAVALHTLTGHPPPPGVGELDSDAWSARITARLAGAGVPPELVAVIGRAMSLDPDLRGSAADFALDLRAAGTPVAVELAAGRARVEPSMARLAAIAAGRPAGSAALPAEPVPGAPPVTADVRLPSPLPAARHRLIVPRPSRAPALLAVALLVTALIVGVVVFGTGHRGGTTQANRTAPTRRSVQQSPATGARPATGVALTMPDAAAVLHALHAVDATRAGAYAHRDPDRLARIYANPALLARDQATLTALVPPGCGLRGVRTIFGAPHVVHANADTVALTVSATVRRSRLWCAGRPAGAAPGAARVILAVRLRHGASGWRITAEQPSGT